MTAHLKIFFSVMLGAILGLEEFAEEGVILFNKAFREWAESTPNPILKIVTLGLHLVFLVLSFAVGLSLLLLLAVGPILLFMELLRWLTVR